MMHHEFFFGGPRHGQGGHGGHGHGRGGHGRGFGGGFPPFARGFWGPFFRRGRARRGDVRSAILLVLADKPLNGYQIMQELESRSGGAWRPSPGSVYPALQQLEDEELVSGTAASAGGRVFQLTAKGKRYVEENRDELDATSEAWGDEDGADDRAELFDHVRQIAMALAQVGASGDAKQVAAAKKILAATRKSLYRLLAGESEP